VNENEAPIVGPSTAHTPEHRHDPRDDHRDASVLRLTVAAALNVTFGVVQVVVGLLIGAVVVLADAAHQAVDALGLITALVALRIARAPADDSYTYGRAKSDALGGLVSALLLFGSVAWIVWESIRRLVEPEEVSGASVMVIGAVAIAVNGAGVLLVGHGHGDEAMSLRAARLHLITDLLGSVIVVMAGAVLAAGGPLWTDPVASLILSAAVLWSTWQLARDAAGVLLDRVPDRVSAGAVQRSLAAQAGVERVHHLHLRPLGGGDLSVTAHVVVDGRRSVHDAQDVVDQLNDVLLSEYRIGHSTLQVECHPCEDDGHPPA
jgi:cobalt-zinc-cadmium efflux system protein